MLGLDNPVHILFLLILLLLVFGAKRLPEMGRSLGSGMRGFKDSLSGDSQQAPPTAIQPGPATVVGAPPAAAVATPSAAAIATAAPVSAAAPTAAPAAAPAQEPGAPAAA